LAEDSELVTKFLYHSFDGSIASGLGAAAFSPTAGGSLSSP